MSSHSNRSRATEARRPAPGTVSLRPAVPADLGTLRRWDEEPHVIASDPNDDWRWETELAEDWPWRDQLIASVDDLPIGFLQIIDPAEDTVRIYHQCRRCLPLTEVLGTGVYVEHGDADVVI